ncbi:NUDIX hydrolase [Anoxybacillus sp. UARK-01]|uniref:NUDIX domain-containing protein n=1 Tax=Anoxybacteroides rupiense TaxID=311460 RepID=A0ABD5IU40_9BACL|nr:MULTISPECIES: NUDIX domain-containing protein [Anoxybacillus]MED5051309.1 NUDIX domain-containing protein [Anoxybacillus rupiensis]OQM46156.1 NUDIX hydrolase [Anoxybacillus sp. UARK-01]
MITKVVQWGEAKVRLTWNPDTQLPPRHLITSAHAFCFQDGKLLLVNLNHRGWDFPGGHMEQGETPTECVKREAYEEGYVRGSCFLLGHIVVDHSANPKWDESSPYPKIGYQVFYRMDIEQVLDFEGKYESVERIFINPNEVIDYYHDWNELYQEILYRAINPS